MFERLALVLLLVSLSAMADDYVLTGRAVRVKKFGFLKFDVYQVESWVKGALPAKSKQGVIEAPVDKYLELEFLRDVEVEKITDSFREGYAACGLKHEKRVEAMMDVFKQEFKKAGRLKLSYHKDQHQTTVTLPGGASHGFVGDDFMRATWCIWLDKGLAKEQPELADELVSKL